jgi:glyoxylase-like metal-dependent hydrolase (beta-lactamase superfamily II)
LNVIKEAFPEAKIVASAAAIDGMKNTWEAKQKAWKPMYKDAVTSKELFPEPTEETKLTIDGQTVEIRGGVQGDEKDNSYVWIPSTKTVIGGDIIYQDVHVWTLNTTADERKEWIKTLDEIAALNPKLVVPGHTASKGKNDRSSIKFTKNYLIEFDKALASSKTKEEFLGKMNKKYGKAKLDVILKMAADANFPEKKQ